MKGTTGEITWKAAERRATFREESSKENNGTVVDKGKQQMELVEEEDGSTVYSNKRRKRKTAGEAGMVQQSYPRERKSEYDRKRRLPSIFIGNIPIGTHKKDLWSLFAGQGKVADVFIANQNGNSRGNRRIFAFVRFFYHSVVEGLLKNHKEFFLQGEKLVIRKAMETRNKDKKDQELFKTTQTEQRSYAQIVKEGVKGNHGKNVFMQDNREAKKIKGQTDWITRSIVGVMRSFEYY